MKRFGGASRAKRPAQTRSSAVNQSFRGGATPAVRDYLGELGDAEIRASRGRAPGPASRARRSDVAERRVSESSRAARGRGPGSAPARAGRSSLRGPAPSRSDRPATRGPAPTRAGRAAARGPAPSSRDRAAATRRESLRALDQNVSRGQTARARAASAGAPGGGGRAVATAGGAAALTVGKAMVDVARPAAAAAKPVLRVVTGGLEKLPSGPGAQAAARGRILIVVAGLLAAGLIYINVGKLEAGDGYGRYAQRSLELQRENTIIRSKVAALESSERIARRAKKLGMVMPQPEQFKYLRERPGDPVRAMRNYTAPTPVVEQPAAEAPVAQQPAAAPDTGAAPAPAPAPQPVPQTQQPVTAPGAVAPGTTAPGTAAPGAGTGAPAVGGN